MLRPPAHARSLCLARTCLRWEECVVWEEGGWGPRGKRCGAFQKDRFLWEIFPEIKVLSAEIRVRKYTYNRREILVWANVPRVVNTRVTQTQGALGPYSSCCE